MRGAFIFPLLCLAGCASTGAAPLSVTPAWTPASFATKQDNPAKGTKTCTVQQTASAYLAKKNGMGIASSILAANVKRDGSIGLAVTEDVYPGTKAYFLVDGKRYSGDGRTFVNVPAAPLVAESKVAYTYTDWPYGGDHSDDDILVGFKSAYEDCLAFLK